MRLAAALLAILPVAAHAADPSLTVFGFELGKPLMLPVCEAFPSYSPRDMKSYKPHQPVTCVEAEDRTGLDGRPSRAVRFSDTDRSDLADGFSTIEDGGRLLGMDFHTRGVALQDYVVEKLSARFGKPTEVVSRPVGNLAGARFDSIMAVWSSGPVHASYISAFGRFDQGYVTIALPEGLAIRSKPPAPPGRQP